MAFGLRLYDGGGGLLLNATPNLGRTLGVVQVSGDGQLDNGQFSIGRPWLYFQATNTDAGGLLPDVWIEGITLYWRYNNNTPGVTNAPAFIFYGIY